MKCGRGPAQGKDICPAASDKAFDGMNGGLNAGRSCWLVAGTACKGSVSGIFAKEFETCRKCDFFKNIHAQNGRVSLAVKNIDIVACTHPGLAQETNEDRYLVKTMDENTLLLSVADGLGGDVSSDIAAEMARGRLASLSKLPVGRETEFLDGFAKDLDLFIHKKAQTHPGLAYMATTLVCAVLKNDMIHWVNVGDSRLYVLRDGEIKQITKDQTLAKRFVEEGALKSEDADEHYSQKILDQCLGYGTCEPETGNFQVKQGDTIILATDGLYKMIERGMMLKILKNGQSLKQKITALTDAALSSGGKDNITIVLAHIKQTR
jgi:protein phosphatase